MNDYAPLPGAVSCRFVSGQNISNVFKLQEQSECLLCRLGQG
uniref:Uncharacterized protein n=1 Tax=Arundo donax TaxID=35708 RepID=A0A0A9GI15_ARUDO